MKRKIKRVKKESRQTTGTVGVASLIVTALIMTMLYFSVDASCSAVTKKIGVCEKRLSALNAELVRENARWDEMKTPERLAVQLRRFGLEMSRPREDQLVRMDAAGRPVPGQLAVARMTRGKNRTEVVVRNGRKR